MNYKTFIQQEFNEKAIAALREKISHDYNDANDAIQDAILIVLQKPEAFLQELYEKRKLKPYILSTIYITTKFSNSKFNRNIKKERNIISIDAPEFIREIPNEVQPTAIDESIIEVISQLNEYELNILELYSQTKSVREVAKITGIHYSNIFHTIKYCRNFVKNKIKENVT